MKTKMSLLMIVQIMVLVKIQILQMQNVEEKEEEPPKIEPVVEVVNIDYFLILMQEYEDNKIWIEEYIKNNKPKKKLDKKKLNKDIFEIDFMCD